MNTFKLSIYLVVVVALLITACATPATPTSENPPPTSESIAPTTAPTQEEKITLTVWWYGEPEAPGLGKWIKAYTDEYQKSHPNVNINLVEQSIDAVTSGFRAAAASKSGPDIAYFFSGGVYVMEDAWAGNIAPISDYVSAEQLSEWIDTGSKSFDGKVWTMPFYMQSYLMMYNKDLFKKAGLDPEKPPVTIDEFLSACQALNKAGITPLSAGMKDGFMGGLFYSELGVQTLTSPTSIQKAAVGQESFTDPEHAEWWNILDKMVKANCFNKDINSLDMWPGMELFTTGKSAMVQAIDGFLPGAIKNLGAENVGIMRMPRFSNGPMGEDMCAFSAGMGITSWSPNKEEAAKYLVGMHEKANVDSFYDTTSIPFGDRKFDSSKIASPQQKAEYDWITTRPQYCPELPMPLQIYETGLLPATQGIFQGSLTPEDAAKKLDTSAANWRDSKPADLEHWLKWASQ